MTEQVVEEIRRVLLEGGIDDGAVDWPELRRAWASGWERVEELVGTRLLAVLTRPQQARLDALDDDDDALSRFLEQEVPSYRAITHDAILDAARHLARGYISATRAGVS
jgi:hypothetical protein